MERKNGKREFCCFENAVAQEEESSALPVVDPVLRRRAKSDAPALSTFVRPPLRGICILSLEEHTGGTKERRKERGREFVVVSCLSLALWVVADLLGGPETRPEMQRTTRASTLCLAATTMLLLSFSSFPPLALAIAPPILEETVLISENAQGWKYYDQGVINNYNWVQPAFDDSGWSVGQAPLGYDTLSTFEFNRTIGYGGNAGNKHAAAYFRRTFTFPGSVATPAACVRALRLDAQLDDGAVVYVNGVLLARSNMRGQPTEQWTSSDPNPRPAQWAVLNARRGEWYNMQGPPASPAVLSTLLPNPQSNTIAVMVAQATADSTDLVFNMRLTAVYLPNCATLTEPSTTIVNKATQVWKVWDSGDPSASFTLTEWKQVAFDDSGWPKQGVCNDCGYGELDETTTLGFGGDPGNVYMTTYYRTSVTITDVDCVSRVELVPKIDDGIFLYVNGVRVGTSLVSDRERLIPLFSDSTSRAMCEPCDPIPALPDNGHVEYWVIDPRYLREGTNVVAAEIHQNQRASSDLSFALDVAIRRVVECAPAAVGSTTGQASSTGVFTTATTASTTAPPSSTGVFTTATTGSVTTSGFATTTGVLSSTGVASTTGIPAVVTTNTGVVVATTAASLDSDGSASTGPDMWWLWLVIAAAVCCCCCLFVAAFFLIRKKRGEDTPAESVELGDSVEDYHVLSLNTSGTASPSAKERASLYLTKDASEKWAVDTDEVEIKKEIGNGSFGVVYLASFRGAEVACKSLSQSTVSAEALEEFKAGEFFVFLFFSSPHLSHDLLT
jgi:hypothetical protein